MSNRIDDNNPPETEVVWLDDTAEGGNGHPSGEVLSIKNVAKMFGVSRLSLLYYEFRGLIRRRNSVHGVRVYSWADCERLALILKCRKADIVFTDVAAVIWATDIDASPHQFKFGQDACMALIGSLTERRKVLDQALAELRHVQHQLNAKLLEETGPTRRD
jgi:DNA-binding transcriptional MerR regulator